jgi:hypothetical protein
LIAETGTNRPIRAAGHATWGPAAFFWLRRRSDRELNRKGSKISALRLQKPEILPQVLHFSRTFQKYFGLAPVADKSHTQRNIAQITAFSDLAAKQEL